MASMARAPRDPGCVAPLEIENCLLSHPAGCEAAVIAKKQQWKNRY